MNQHLENALHSEIELMFTDEVENLKMEVDAFLDEWIASMG